MPHKGNQFEPLSAGGKPAPARAAPIMVSGRWILGALIVVIFAAVLCTWGSLCLLFWQGAWQFLYRPTAAVARTPEAAGLDFSPVDFATNDAGETLIHGWWIPARAGATKKGSAAGAQDGRPAHYTVLYLHGNVGNLGDCVAELAAIHKDGVDILAFDYRGYGQSKFIHPSEAHWREDADWALDYLTDERHVRAKSVILVGSGLGADLALEVAAAHPELAGVVLDSPLASPVDAVFKDSRAQWVPAHRLFRDRYEMGAPAESLRIPCLWILAKVSASGAGADRQLHAIYGDVRGNKTLDHLSGEAPHSEAVAAEIEHWLPTLHAVR
jgi:pimeloyl-ACP methyl ester carboxylesterase